MQPRIDKRATLLKIVRKLHREDLGSKTAMRSVILLWDLIVWGLRHNLRQDLQGVSHMPLLIEYRGQRPEL